MVATTATCGNKCYKFINERKKVSDTFLKTGEPNQEKKKNSLTYQERAIRRSLVFPPVYSRGRYKIKPKTEQQQKQHYCKRSKNTDMLTTQKFFSNPQEEAGYRGVPGGGHNPWFCRLPNSRVKHFLPLTAIWERNVGEPPMPPPNGCEGEGEGMFYIGVRQPAKPRAVIPFL